MWHLKPTGLISMLKSTVIHFAISEITFTLLNKKVSGFQPSKETLAIATQVFRAAIAQIKRKS